MRVLIAEDDATSRKILAASATKWGLEPVVVEDGDAAWEVLQQASAPRLLLLDRGMPGVDGLEICRRLREIQTPDAAYVIIVTARGQTSDIVEGLAAGANDYVCKPYDSAELRARIGVGQRMLALQSDLLEAKVLLEHQATHDPLTGVLSRRAILETLHGELSRARRESGLLTVGMFDLDHFKSINDSYGHQAGDDVLVGFTQRIQAGLRDYDRLGRYGGEEFLLIAPHSRGAAPEELYERLRRCVAESGIDTRAGTVRLTVSIGLTTATGDEKADALIGAADAALYEAKARGRNCVACHAGAAREERAA